MQCSELFEFSVDDQHQALSSHYANAASDPNVATYTGQSSRRLNGRFLGKGSFWGRGKDQRTIAGLQKLIAQSPPLQQPLRVYSNTGAWNPLHDIENNVLVTKPFTSTSLDYDLVFRFGTANPKRQHIILQFDLPAGYDNGVYVGHAEVSANQKEFILGPNQRWRVTGTHQVDYQGKQWTIVELVPA